MRGRREPRPRKLYEPSRARTTIFSFIIARARYNGILLHCYTFHGAGDCFLFPPHPIICPSLCVNPYAAPQASGTVFRPTCITKNSSVVTQNLSSYRKIHAYRVNTRTYDFFFFSFYRIRPRIPSAFMLFFGPVPKSPLSRSFARPLLLRNEFERQTFIVIIIISHVGNFFFFFL